MEGPSLPERLLAKPPTTKLLYAWLEPQGAVSYSVREVAEALELSHKAVQDGLTHLREAGLLADVVKPKGARKGVFRVRRDGP